MITKTNPSLVQKVAMSLGDCDVVHHQPTVANQLGQSGVHTFVDDILNIVLESSDEQAATRNLVDYLRRGIITDKDLR